MFVLAIRASFASIEFEVYRLIFFEGNNFCSDQKEN